MMEQDERLRDAFAQLLAQQGPQGAVPAETLWARQGLDQLSGVNTPPVPGQYLDRSATAGNFEPPGTVVPQRQFDLADPTLEFPGAASKPPIGEPFHGKGIVAETTDRPWELPKKKTKKKGKS